jgi:anti-anti-sigma regulatory factor
MTETVDRLHCAVHREAASATLRLAGQLTRADVRVLGAHLNELIRSGQRHLVVDMSELAEVAAVSVGVLNRSIAELRHAGGTLALRGLDGAKLPLLMRAGLHPAIRVVPPG